MAYQIGDIVIWKGFLGDPDFVGEVIGFRPESVHGGIVIATGEHRRPSEVEAAEIRPIADTYEDYVTYFKFTCPDSDVMPRERWEIARVQQKEQAAAHAEAERMGG